MLAIRTILHATDFSDRSSYALSLACALTRDYCARLVLLHVTQMPIVIAGEGMISPLADDYRAEGSASLQKLVLPVADVRAERRVEDGDPATEIVRVAKELPADLIVLGTHGRTGLERLLMGSVAEHVLRKAPCPVMTVTKPFTAST